METTAIIRGVHISAQKTRLVADLIRGKSVAQALNILTFAQEGRRHPEEGCRVGYRQRRAQRRRRYRRVEGHHHFVDKAQSMKRFSARAKGRGNRIEKQTCHITVKVGA